MKSRAFLYGSAACFVVTLLCAIEYKTGGDDIYRGLVIAGLAFGILLGAGLWASMLPRRENAEDPEWDKVTR